MLQMNQTAGNPWGVGSTDDLNQSNELSYKRCLSSERQEAICIKGRVPQSHLTLVTENSFLATSPTMLDQLATHGYFALGTFKSQCLQHKSLIDYALSTFCFCLELYSSVFKHGHIFDLMQLENTNCKKILCIPITTFQVLQNY